MFRNKISALADAASPVVWPELPGIEKARVGKLMMQAGLIINALRVPLTLIILLIVASVPVLAQSTPGPIFNGSPSTFGNMIREGLKLLSILLYCAGAVFAALMIVNLGRKTEWTNQLIGALGCFAFGVIVSVIYSVSQGQPVNVPTDF